MEKEKVTSGFPQPQKAIVNFTQNPGYVKKSRGYPVEIGQTWRDLTAQQRREWFTTHESRWKDKFGIQNAGLQGNMGWSRG